MVLKVNSKTSNFRGIACTAALLMSGNPGYVCWGWLNVRHQPRRLTKARRAGGEVQIEAM